MKYLTDEQVLFLHARLNAGLESVARRVAESKLETAEIAAWWEVHSSPVDHQTEQ